MTPDGCLRLDALTRYTQDVSDDDTTDAGLDTEPAWVVRRTMIDVVEPARLGETIELTTFCSGLGRRWAERRLVIRGDGGAEYEVSTLWICIDAVTGRPHSLTGQFLELYRSAAGGREVKARLTIPKPPEAATGRSWPLRVVDFDTLGHVNNAAYWAVVEEALAGRPVPRPYRALVEYGSGLGPDAEVTIVEGDDHDGRRRLLWWSSGDGLAASASLEPLAP